jgi:glycosyltransferase involved in cell wall biosynthesis
MRILFISSYFLEDPKTSVYGIYKRMDTLIEAIKQVAAIDMLFYVKPDRNYTHSEISELEKTLSNHWNTSITLHICPRSETNTNNYLSLIIATGAGIPSFLNQKGYKEFSGTKQLKALEECLQRSPDAIFAHRLEAMCPLLRISKRPLPPIIFDLDDIEHIVLERYIKNRNNLRSNLLRLLLPSLTRGECEAVKLASKTFVCSENDRKYLREKFKLPGVTVIPNSISIPKLEPLTEEPNLLYLSSDYGPNIQAAEYLVNDIWPKIKNEIPQARLILAGVSADKFNFRKDNVPGLEIPGFVEDLDALYKSIRATAVSLLVGGGTRFKIIEAAMYGKPTVSTKIGAEGIELADTSEILIEDAPKSFAEACIKLLSDKDLSEEIGLAARKKAKDLYDRQNIVVAIKKLILEAVK